MVNKSIALVAALVLMTGCSTMSNLFKNDKEKASAPSPLTDIASPIAIKKLWSVSIGDGEGDLGVRQKPVLENNLVFAADTANRLVDDR
jgi:outer membrane protein assembly factor BamB